MSITKHKQKQTQLIAYGIPCARLGVGNRGQGAGRHKPSRCLPRLRLISLFAVLVLATTVSGCGGPALTSNALSGNATNSYLDTVQHANPTGTDAASVGLKIGIVRRGDNTTDRLIARVNEAKGTCDRNREIVRCIIDKSIVERNCFQGRCGDSRKRWTLAISWRDIPGTIDPQVTLKISWPERP